MANRIEAGRHLEKIIAVAEKRASKALIKAGEKVRELVLKTTRQIEGLPGSIQLDMSRSDLPFNTSMEGYEFQPTTGEIYRISIQDREVVQSREGELFGMANIEPREQARTKVENPLVWYYLGPQIMTAINTFAEKAK
jgi:hypothetical protein